MKFKERSGLIGSFLISTILAITLTACGGGGGGGSTSSGGGGTPPPAPSGLRLQITDAPVDDLYEVWVTFTEAIVHPADGSADIVVPVPGPSGSGMSIELTALGEGQAVMLLEETALPAADYSWIRLTIDPAQTYVIETVGGGQLPLDCPSCENSGLKLNRSFTIDTTGWVDFTIDFDLRKSITYTKPNGYKLRPTLRIIDTELASSQISGTVIDNRSEQVDPLTPEGCVVYIYEGDSTTIVPDDICEIEDTNICPAADRPYTSADVIYDATTTEYRYMTGYLYPGIYTAALLCENDDPDIDDDVTFVGELPADASVAGETALPAFTLDDIPALSVLKELTGNADEDSSTTVTIGDTLTYTITATNSGNITLNNVVVSDSLITPASANCPAVAVDATCTLEGTYVVTEDGATAGQTEIVNTGSAVSDAITTAVTDEVTTPVAVPPAP